MPVYVVNRTETLLVDTTSINLSLDYIANPELSVLVYKDGLLLTLHADYEFINVVSYPYTTTFTLQFVQPAVAGTVIRIDKNEEWNQWILFTFPLIDARLAALEAKLTTANDVALRLTILEANLAQAQADILALNATVSGHASEIDQAQLDITAIQNASISSNVHIDALEKFLGVESTIVINNNQLVPLEIPELTTDGYVHSSVVVSYEIMRMIGTEYRSSVGILNLVCKGNGVWYTERGLTVIDLDGVTFTIATSVGKIGTISYISDYMLGLGYIGTFKVRITKFEV